MLKSWLWRWGPALVLVTGLVLFWEIYVQVSGIRPTVLPGPRRVLTALLDFQDVIIENTGQTLLETVL
ncbi:MAG: ABC transporter permease, partial [Chloroflexota bacterium]